MLLTLLVVLGLRWLAVGVLPGRPRARDVRLPAALPGACARVQEQLRLDRLLVLVIVANAVADVAVVALDPRLRSAER